MFKKFIFNAAALYSSVILAIAVTLMGLFLGEIPYVLLGSIVGGVCWQQAVEYSKE